MRAVWVVLVLAALACTASDAAAQSTLAWKLTDGNQFDLHVQQQTSSTATVVNKTVKTTIEMTLDSIWSVESAQSGIAKIRQTVRRVQVQVQAADAPPAAYDTAAPGQPSGAARDLAAAVKPLVDPESSIVLTMNERGEILSAELSPKLAELWDAGQTGQSDKRGPMAESLDALLRQPLVVLPENEVSRGDKWNSTRELATPAGKFTQKIEYTADGRQESAGTTADVILYAATLAPVTPGKSKIKEQSQTGVILFDGQAGRLVSSEQTQKLVTETPYRDATITVAIESQIKRTLKSK